MILVAGVAAGGLGGLLAPGCGGDPDCSEGKARVRVALPSGVDASGVTLVVQIESEQRVVAEASAPADARGTAVLEVEFPAGYPRGRRVLLRAHAARASEIVALGTVERVMPESCLAQTLVLFAEPGALGDAGAGDARPADASGDAGAAGDTGASMADATIDAPTGSDAVLDAGADAAHDAGTDGVEVDGDAADAPGLDADHSDGASDARAPTDAEDDA